jgi:predicted nucleotide-binding protein
MSKSCFALLVFRSNQGVNHASRNKENGSAAFHFRGACHDEGMLDAVTTELKGLDVVPVVLNRVRTSNDHLFAKFKAVASDANHAIVLISGDDIGASFSNFVRPAGVGARLEFQARENVILEVGYFRGKLGEERVFVFRKAPPETDRMVRRPKEPSDLAGKIFDNFSGDWRTISLKRLKKASFPIAA